MVRKDHTAAMKNAEASVRMEGCKVTPQMREQCRQVLSGKTTTAEVLKRFSTGRPVGDGEVMTERSEDSAMLYHRGKVYEAEVSRQKGEPTFSQEELDCEVEAVLLSFEPES